MSRLSRVLAPLAALLAIVTMVSAPLAPAQGSTDRCARDTPGQPMNTCVTQLLYFNDGHDARPVPDGANERGGVARLKTVVDTARAENPHTSVSFGGDLAGGTLFGGIYHGHPMVDAFNRIGVDVATFGQHDFDFGVANTRSLVAGSRFPWVSSNLVDGQGRPFSGLTWHVQQAGAHRVGYLGLTDAMDTTTAGADVDQQPVVESARRAVDAMAAARPDVVVALTQQGLAENEALLDAVPEIDVVLTEELAETESRLNSSADGRWILSPEGNLGSVIKVEISRHGNRTSIVPSVLEVDSTVTPDPQLRAFEEHYDADLRDRLGEKIAPVATPLLRTDNSHRKGESALGNLVADALRAPTSFADGQGAQIGWMQAGGLRADVPGPDFTLESGYSVLPFGNRVVKVDATGAQVREGLEQGLARYESLGGGFPQVSGLAYTFDPSRPVGQRVVSVTVGGGPLVATQRYTVAMSNYVAGGGDGVTAFTSSPRLVDTQTAMVDAEALIAFVRTLDVVDYAVSGRITRL